MHYFLQEWVAETLGKLNRRWSRSLELGCGTGDGGELLRPYTAYLLGVDIDPSAVKVAQERGCYDEVYVGDARQYPLQGFDSVFMYEVIEHISKQQGQELLNRIGNRFLMLSTPWWSVSLVAPWFWWDGHRCLWSEEELRKLGFKTSSYNFIPEMGMSFLYGGEIIGVRE